MRRELSRSLLSISFVCLVGLYALPLKAENRVGAPFIEGHLSKDVIKRTEIDYRIYLPDGHGDTDESWPLLLWLHGDGGQASRGGWEEILSYGPPSMLKKGRKFPFVLLVPQLWGEVHWDPDSLHVLLQESIHKYNIDPDRVYLMGHSRGGFGAWELACSYPETFAAVVPISARPMTAIERVRDMGIWIFHGEIDTGVPLGGALNMYQELKVLEADVRLTVFPGVAHNAVAPAMQSEQLWQWLLAQKR